MKLKKIEIALIMACILTTAVFAAPSAAGEGIYQKTIRLHVVANSDSKEDQRIKLLIRDRILDDFSGMIKECGGVSAAEKAIAERLSDIMAAADDEIGKKGSDYRCTAEIKEMHFDTRDYEMFSLPGGKYKTLYVVLGEGKGKNWWCVLFPPLCTASALTDIQTCAFSAGLSTEDVALITEGKYQIRFKTLEVIDKVRQFFDE